MRAWVRGWPMRIIYSLLHGITISYVQPRCTREIPSAGGCCNNFWPYWNSCHSVAQLLSPWRQPDVVQRHLNPPTFIQGAWSPWDGGRVGRHLLTFHPAAAENNQPDSIGRLFLKHQAALHTFTHWTHTIGTSITLTSPSALRCAQLLLKGFCKYCIWPISEDVLSFIAPILSNIFTFTQSARSKWEKLTFFTCLTWLNLQ